jgi:Ca-activated chloride channel family protein
MNESPAFTLACRDGHSQPPVLRDVAATARLAGTLFEMTLRQTYRNSGSQLLEVVYTFPLMPRGVLLGFATELNGVRMQGQVLPRRQAEQAYEAALSEGDAPVMLEAHADGLHTANIGNLKPGDEIVVEVRVAQVVAPEQGRLRLVVPATIAPRYGNPADAGLQPQQAPVASVTADYPLAFTLAISGALAQAAVTCPTHPVVSRRTDAGLEIALAPTARLDRDVVLVVTPTAPGAAVVTQAHDARAASAPCVLLATLPVPDAPRREHVALKLLVDCSGSMGGDSMSSARRALQGIAAQLAPADSLSLTRFGCTVEHASPLARCTPAVIQRFVQDIAATDANLGGTEMASALAAVFALSSRDHATRDGFSDVLMITDGEVWDVEPLIETAQRAAQRVFVIGVGASPAEGPLRRLAQATGGACEFATPGEALEAAAERMLARIRQLAWTGLRVDWGGAAAWQGELPLCAFAGDTLDVFAGLRAASDAPVRLLSRGADGVDIVLASAAVRELAADDTLPRVAAAGRLAALPSEAATALAVDYQLMSAHTHCVMVHPRAQADRSTDEAQLHRVENMLAAGWGAMGSVMAESAAFAGGAMPAPMRDMRAMPQVSSIAPMMKRRKMAAIAPDLARESGGATIRSRIDVVDAQTTGAGAPASKPSGLSALLNDLAEAIRERLWKRAEIRTLMERCRALGVFDAATEAIDDVVRLGVSDPQAWALLVGWLDRRTGSDVFASIPQELQLRIQRLDPDVVAAASAVFDRRLAAIDLTLA